MNQVKHICVCGAGTMGSGIAQVAAQHGFGVIQFDLNEAMLQKSRAGIEKNLDFLISKQKISPQDKDQVLNRIRFTSRISDCVADVIIEAIIENREAKVNLFKQLSAINSPQVVFATNTSSISVKEIAAGVPDPSRVAGMHFFNPAPLMKLVEVIRGEQTSDATTERARTPATTPSDTATGTW